MSSGMGAFKARLRAKMAQAGRIPVKTGVDINDDDSTPYGQNDRFMNLTRFDFLVAAALPAAIQEVGKRCTASDNIVGDDDRLLAVGNLAVSSALAALSVMNGL